MIARHLNRLLNSLEEKAICFLLTAMTLLAFCETLLRFMWGVGISWAQETTLYLLAWFVLFGASYGVKTGVHISVDALTRQLGAKARSAAAAVMAVAAVVYCGLLLYGSWVYLSKLHRIGIEMEDLPIPRWVADAILVIGFGLLALRFCQQFLRALRNGDDQPSTPLFSRAAQD